jgi:hypothetical protein
MYHPNQKDRNFCLRVCVYYNTTRDRNERTIAVALRDVTCVCALKLYVQLFPIVLPIALPTPRHQDLLLYKSADPFLSPPSHCLFIGRTPSTYNGGYFNASCRTRASYAALLFANITEAPCCAGSLLLGLLSNS